jgi:hypothetical protein
MARPERFAHLSKSSRFSLRFMRRTNILAIVLFTGGILYKTIQWIFFKD